MEIAHTYVPVFGGLFRNGMGGEQNTSRRVVRVSMSSLATLRVGYPSLCAI